MRYHSVLLAILAGSSTARQIGCRTSPPTKSQESIMRHLQMSEHKDQGAILEARPGGINIDVYFHVIANSTNSTGGFIPPSRLDRQLQMMNQDFNPIGIHFTQVGADWVVRPEWTSRLFSDQATDLELGRTLRKGSYADLNVYVVASQEFNEAGLAGYAYPPGLQRNGAFAPSAPRSETDEFAIDGVVVNVDTLPDGSFPNFGLGKTATHEIGHWLGLWHTFQGGCSGEGDFIFDTPAEAYNSSTFGTCDEKRDSCPDDPGLDAVHNHMSYSGDDCRFGFSNGQENRIYMMWGLYRASAQVTR